MISILLQIATETATTAATTTSGLSFFELLLKGGPVMIPIVLLSFISIYIMGERYFYLRQASKVKPDFVQRVNKYLKEGDIKGARMFAEQEATATSAIILVGLDSLGRPMKEIDSMIESVANIELAEMEKHMGYLGIIAGIAPMLGFIGTISGIIRIFYSISLSDNISIGIIAGGLYEKMITSGSGLIVGVIAYAGYHLLQMKIGKFTLQMQRSVLEFMRAITK